MEGYSCSVGKGVLKICMGDNYTDATVVFFVSTSKMQSMQYIMPKK